MAKILVADDNSNIQKMVGLALKDQGIDVVAVGNGEAAVRKISEIRPDLVLADVFMPVRNGYEVCEYVKQDSSLAHIPVILLVGAFDPLDEQEAQRVGADGVLKKPFVPPDPLISMVKAALSRAGVPYSSEPKDKTAGAPGKRAADLLPTRSVVPAPPPAAVREVLPAVVEAESLVEEVPAKRPEFTIAEGDKTLAFGNLLNTPGLTEEVDDSAYVTAKTTEFDIDRKWGAESDESEEEVEEEEEEETAASSSWRRDADGESKDVEAAKPKRDWRTVEPATARSAHEIQLTTAVKNPADETADIAPILGTKPLPSFSGDAWAAAISAGTQEKVAAEKPELVTKEAAPGAVPQVAVHAAEETPEAASPDTNKSNSWISTPPSPWIADDKTAKPFSSGWDAPVVTAPVIAPSAPAETEEVEAEAKSEVAETAQFISGDTLIDSELETEPEQPAASPYAAETWHGDVDPALEQAAESLHLPTETVHLLQEQVDAVVASHQEEIAAETPAAAPYQEEIVKEEISYGASPVLEQSDTKPVEAVVEPKALVTKTAPAGHEAAAAPEPEVAKTPEVDMEALVARVLARMSPEALQAMTREILKPVLENIIRDELNAKKS